MDGSWPWWVWMIFFFGFMSFIGGWRGSCGPSSSRRSRRSAEASNEIARLKAELDNSHAQIAALKSRLEAVETIVTDEENELRREFRKLQERPA